MAKLEDLVISLKTVEQCYLVVENIVVIENNCLVLAHPIFYRKFITFFMELQRRIQNFALLVRGIIDGFAFEAEFLRLIPNHSLQLYCRHQDRELHLSVKFNEVKVLKTAFVKTPIRGTLYHLHPSHPVINMIGSYSGFLWMFQLSLQPYQNHETKFEDLFKPSPKFGDNTIISYYTALFKMNEERVRYIYRFE